MEELDGLRSIVPELEGIVVIAFAPSALDAAPLSGGLMLPAQQQGVRRTGRSAVSVQAHAARFDFGGAVDRGGDVRGITASASRRFDGRTTASVFASVRRGEIKSNRLTSSLDQTQVSAGLAVVRRLSERVVASVLAYFGRADNDINLDGGIGSFDTTTLGAIGRLQGRWSFYPWVVEPHVILDVRRVSRDGYTDTAAVVVPGSTRTYGTLSVGKRVSRPHFYDGQSGQHSLFLLEPYWQVDGHWRFAGAQDQTLPNSGPLVLSHARLYGSVAAGVNAVLYSGHQSGAQIAYHGIGSRYEAVSGTLHFTFASGARLAASVGFASGGGAMAWDGAPVGAFTSGTAQPADMFAGAGGDFFAGARLTIPLQ